MKQIDKLLHGSPIQIQPRYNLHIGAGMMQVPRYSVGIGFVADENHSLARLSLPKAALEPLPKHLFLGKYKEEANGAKKKDNRTCRVLLENEQGRN